MNIKRNILANYISQIFMAVVGIIMVPTYVRYLGIEAYGLVGFFALLQGWFQLLDIGLTPTIMREISRYRGGATDAQSLRQLVRALERIFIGVAVVGMTIVLSGSGFIANHWLKASQLSRGEIRRCIMIMGIIIAARWMSDLFRGAINGFGKLVWLSGFNIAISSLKSILVLAVLVAFGRSVTVFFVYQLFIAIMELIILVLKTYQCLPRCDKSRLKVWSWAPIRGVLKFSLGIALTGSLWVMATQTGTLVLSRLLPLKAFGYFTLANISANGVLLLAGPISGAILPRLARLSAEGDEAGFLKLYIKSSQLVAIITFPTALMLAGFASQALWVWTGNPDIAHQAGPVLMLYAIGNGIMSIGAFPYYLQYAKGDLKLHIVGSILYFLLYLPTLILLTLRFGAIGAGCAWIIINLLFLVLWLPRVHARFYKGLNKVWFRSIGSVLFTTLAVVLFSLFILPWRYEHRSIQGVVLCGMGGLAALGALLGTPQGRSFAFNLFGRFSSSKG